MLTEWRFSADGQLSDNMDPHFSKEFIVKETAAPATPDAGFVYVYAKTDGKLYSKDDAGVETELGAPAPASPTAETSIYVDAAAMRPAATNGPAVDDGTDGTNAGIDRLLFDGVTAETAFFKWSPPPQWDGGVVQVEFFWETAGGTAGQYVKWESAAGAISNDDVWDASLGTAVAVEDTITADGDMQSVITGDVTIAGTPADGDMVIFRVTRSVTAVTATASAQDAELWGVRVHYGSAAAGGGDAQITVNINGGGAAITTGLKGFLRVPYAATITAAELIGDQTGSIVVDVWKDSYANFPPTDADSITASAPPTLSSAVKSTDATLTGWTTSLAAGDYLAFNVDSITTVEQVTLSLAITRTI